MRITMFGSARRELMARMAQVALLAIVLIVGPMAEDSRLGIELIGDQLRVYEIDA